MSAQRDLVKLYYRIGEVSQIVGVQPHVLRYWETEFRTIRPQKSHKGQRVYSRKDVEKLLRVKDLLKNQGFTIAGAKRKLREPEAESAPSPEAAVQAAPEVAPAAPVMAVRREAPALAPTVLARHQASHRETRARVRDALVSIREDIAAMLESEEALEPPPRRPKLPTMP